MKDSNSLRKKMNAIIAFSAIVIISFFSVKNGKQFKINVIDPIFAADKTTIKEAMSSSETKFQTNFVYKRELIDLYGVTQKVLQRNIIGNFEFIADENGVIHAMREKPYETDRFIGKIEKIVKKTEEKGIPFLYVQGLNREIVNTDENMFNIDDRTMDELITKMQEKNIATFDLRKQLANNPQSFALTDAFLHTDLHMQSDAEIWAADCIAKQMNSAYQIPIANMDYLENMDNYEKRSHEMIGNYARLVGSHYVKSDTFDLYIPKFPTRYAIDIPAKNEHFEGDFSAIIMNGYENNKIDKYTYWVTDYLRYGEPYYTITNHENPNGPSILVITDSIGYRTLSYLSLTVGKITVLDPRFFNEQNYVDIALENDYDLAMLYQGTFLTDCDFKIE